MRQVKILRDRPDLGDWYNPWSWGDEAITAAAEKNAASANLDQPGTKTLLPVLDIGPDDPYVIQGWTRDAGTANVWVIIKLPSGTIGKIDGTEFVFFFSKNKEADQATLNRLLNPDAAKTAQENAALRKAQIDIAKMAKEDAARQIGFWAEFADSFKMLFTHPLDNWNYLPPWLQNAVIVTSVVAGGGLTVYVGSKTFKYIQVNRQQQLIERQQRLLSQSMQSMQRGT